MQNSPHRRPACLGGESQSMHVCFVNGEDIDKYLSGAYPQNGTWLINRDMNLGIILQNLHLSAAKFSAADFLLFVR